MNYINIPNRGGRFNETAEYPNSTGHEFYKMKTAHLRNRAEKLFIGGNSFRGTTIVADWGEFCGQFCRSMREPIPLASQAESLIGVLTGTRKLEKHLESLTRLSSDALLVLLLIHTRRPASVKELTRHLGVSDSRTSKLLCTLEDRGLVTRRISFADRRVEQISLTPRGDRIVETVLAVNDAPGDLRDARVTLVPFSDTPGGRQV